MPPMSEQCPIEPTSPTICPLRNTGVTTARSKRWPAQTQGSLVMSTSPSSSSLGGNDSKSALIACGSVRLNTGIERGEWAMELARASNSSQPKSCASPMMVENAVRQIVTQHSSVILMRRLHIISSETGSNKGNLLSYTITC